MMATERIRSCSSTSVVLNFSLYCTSSKLSVLLTYLQTKGTGLSSTVTARTLATEGDPAKQAALLTNFRADSIGTISRSISGRDFDN